MKCTLCELSEVKIMSLPEEDAVKIALEANFCEAHNASYNKLIKNTPTIDKQFLLAVKRSTEQKQQPL